MSESTEAKRLHDIAAEILKSASFDAATQKLATAITDDFALAVTIAADYLNRLASAQMLPEVIKPVVEQLYEEPKAKAAPTGTKASKTRIYKTHSRGRKGAHKRAHKSGMPSAAQRAGAMRAEKHFVDKVFERRRRGGDWTTLRMHELRATAQADIHQGVEFLQRGFEDVRDGFICMAIAQHCVAADPYATVPEIIKPALFDQFYRESEIKANKALEECAARAASDLIARAEKTPPVIDASPQ